MKIIKQIPNLFTFTNLALGFLAILLNDPFMSPLIILAAALTDLLDGLLARMLDAQSEYGAQLDSFADLLSFGVAPAYLYFHHFLATDWVSIFVIIFIPVFSTMRLVRYNLDKSDSNYFKGLAVPANGLFFAFMVFGMNSPENVEFHPIVLRGLPIIFSFLMISSIPMMALKKFKLKSLIEKILIYGLFAAAVVIYFFTQWFVIPLVIAVYIFLSLIFAIYFLTKRRAIQP